MERDLNAEFCFNSNPIWGEEPPTLNFRSLPVFMNFYTSIHSQLIRTINENLYDSVTSFVRMHREYKEQGLSSFEEFFAKQYRPSITEDSLNCIGLSLQLRRNLVQQLSDKFPLLESHLFMVSSDEDNGQDLANKYPNGPPTNSGHTKIHSALALKISIEPNRVGYIIMNAAYSISMPVVVMQDQLFPHTGSFWVRGSSDNRFNHFGLRGSTNSYIEWSVAKNAEKSGSNTYRWFYMGKMNKDFMQIDRRSKVGNFHGYIKGDLVGNLAGFFIMLHEPQSISFLHLENQDDQVLTSSSIPAQYFLDTMTDDQTEDLLTKVAIQTKTEKFDLKELLRTLVTVCQDRVFLTQVVKIDKLIVNESKECLGIS